MRFSWKRWRLALIAALTAVAMSVTLASPAVAAEPGEWGTWVEEHVGGQYLAARGTMGEARNNGTLLQVWRGETNNIVWLSFNNGNPFQYTNPDGSSTQTSLSPTVVPYGTNSFMVFHTGTDSRIYYAQVNSDGSWAGSWTAVPWGQSTNMAVSVTQVGAGLTSLYMLYHAANDDRVIGTYWNGWSWTAGQSLSGVLTPAAPSVTYNSYTGLWAVARGEDNQVWMARSYTGTGNNWGNWTAQGGNTYDSPTIAAGSNGQMLVSYVDQNSYRTNFRTYNAAGQPTGNWSQDSAGWQTIYSVGLSVIYNTIYAILTGLDGYVYYKEAYDGS